MYFLHPQSRTAYPLTMDGMKSWSSRLRLDLSTVIGAKRS